MLWTREALHVLPRSSPVLPWLSLRVYPSNGPATADIEECAGTPPGTFPTSDRGQGGVTPSSLPLLPRKNAHAPAPVWHDGSRPLHGMLIDHLAADREALDLGEHLSREVLASRDVRLPLARAAARCGERQRARALLGRAEGTPAAEVLVALAGATLMAGELDEATRLCDEARSHDSAHLGAQEMTRQIARSREDARRPLEAELTRVLETGAIDEARRLAEHLLARFPDSAVARRTVRAAVEQQRASEAERLLNASSGRRMRERGAGSAR